MSARCSIIRTEVRGLDFCLEESLLSVSSSGETILPPVALDPGDAERLRIEMAKAQLEEWNQLEEAKRRAELRYRRYFASWLVMCLAAFSAYLGYPSYYLCIFLSLFSFFLWWRAGYEEKRAADRAQGERNTFRANWNYLYKRLEEDDGEPEAPSESEGPKKLD
jgi:general stress protein CsbA